MEQELLAAIEQLNDTIKALSSNLGLRKPTGRGGRPASAAGAGESGPSLKDFSDSLNDLTKNIKKQGAAFAKFDAQVFENIEKSGDKATASLKKHADTVENSSSTIKEETDSRRDLTAEQKAAIRVQKAEAQSQKELQKERLEAHKDEIDAKISLSNATADLVKSLASGSGNFAAAMSSFGKTARDSSANLTGGLQTVAIGASRLANLLSSLAGSAAFALTMMNAFAKDARSASDFVDLRNLSAGTVTTQKLYSALGDSFIKVINESGGAFRFFGATSQEAVENLAALSRGLRSGAANQRILNNLGPEYARYFEQAADATAALGLSQEEQAALTASIMNNTRLTARTEQDAQQMLVRQYAETTSSARTLSQQFGVSARDILKTMQEFNRSRAGQALSSLGLGEEGQAMFAQLKMAADAMGANISAEDLQAVTLDALRGNTGAAIGLIRERTVNNQAAGANLQSFIENIDLRRQRGEAITSESATAALRSSLEQNRGLAESLSSLQASAPGTGGQALGGFSALQLERQLARGTTQQEADRGARGTRTNEAANIRGVETVQQTVDAVKSAFVGLGATAVGLLGTFGVLGAAAVAAAASLLGMSKLNAARAVTSSALSGLSGAAAAAPAAASAAGAARGAAAVAPAAASAAGSAGAMAKLGQAASSGVASGPGQAIAGFFAAFGGPMAVKVIAGAGVIASVVAILGAGVAGGLALVSLGLKSFSEGLKSLDTIDGDNLERVGQSLKSLGAGMLAFAVASGANVLGAVANGIAGIFGADIVSRIRKAVDELAPVAPQLSIIGPAIQSFGEGLRLFSEAAANIDANRLARILALVRGAGTVDAERLRALSALSFAGQTAPTETREQRVNRQRAAGIYEGASTSINEFALAPNVVSGRQIGYFDNASTPIINNSDTQLFQDMQDRLSLMLMPTETRAIVPEMPATDVRSTVGMFGATNTTAAESTATEIAAPATDREANNEVFKQTLIAYLSTVADDLAAIRGNTRTATGDLLSPVRLG